MNKKTIQAINRLNGTKKPIRFNTNKASNHIIKSFMEQIKNERPVKACKGARQAFLEMGIECEELRQDGRLFLIIK